MSTNRAFLALLGVIALALPGRSWSQSFDPDSKLTEIEQAAIAVVQDVRRAGVPRRAETEPVTSPSAKQTSAATGSGLSPGVVNLADASSLLSAAVDRIVGRANNEAITISLDMFAFVAATDTAVLYDQDRYVSYGDLRRLSGSITLGGAAETTDSTAAPEFESITDIWSVNARWRFHGTRDRREHFRKYREAVRRGGQDKQNEIAIKLAEPLGRATDASERYQVYLDHFRRNPADARAVVEDARQATAVVSAVNDDIDHNLLMTLSVVGEFRKPELGRDKLTIELITQGGHRVDVVGNLAYRYNELEAGGEDQELILALALAKKAFRGSPVLPDGLDVSVGVGGEARNNHRRSIWKVNAKLDLPVQGNLHMTTSVTWANRESLIDEEHVRGNFGLSYDFSAWRPKSGG